jgi:hypothetical protein
MAGMTDDPAEMPIAEPDWLTAWRTAPVSSAEALRRFDSLPGLAPAALLGRWRGIGLATGHPLDGLLEALGWHGKAFETVDRVHPLLFRSGSGAPVALDPALMPVGLALRFPALAHSPAAAAAFRAALPMLTTREPAARLDRVVFRGKDSAAMLYHRQPIVDHFHAIDSDRVLGLMALRGSRQPYLFLLTRERDPG